MQYLISCLGHAPTTSHCTVRYMAIPYAAFLTLIDPLFDEKFEKETLALLA